MPAVTACAIMWPGLCLFFVALLTASSALGIHTHIEEGIKHRKFSTYSAIVSLRVNDPNHVMVHYVCGNKLICCCFKHEYSL